MLTLFLFFFDKSLHFYFHQQISAKAYTLQLFLKNLKKKKIYIQGIWFFSNQQRLEKKKNKNKKKRWTKIEAKVFTKKN